MSQVQKWLWWQNLMVLLRFYVANSQHADDWTSLGINCVVMLKTHLNPAPTFGNEKLRQHNICVCLCLWERGGDETSHNNHTCRVLIVHWVVLWCKTWHCTRCVCIVFVSVCACLCVYVEAWVPGRTCQNIHPSCPCTSFLIREQTGFLVSFYPQSPAAGLRRDYWGGGNYRSKQRETDVQLWEQRFALSPLIAPAPSLQFTMRSATAKSTST